MKTLISILGADIYQDQSGVWHTNDVNMRNHPEREPIDSFRVAAAAQLAKIGTLIYAQGGLADHTYPSISSVMEDELRELGIPRDSISIEERSKSTATQLIQLQDFLRRKMPKVLMIVTNGWHIPRVQAMINHLPEFSMLRHMKYQLVNAEETLLKADPKKWQESIAKARSHPEMKEVIGLEKKGIQQILNGTYERE